MNVAFNPNVNFKSDTNLIAETARKIQQGETQKVTIPRQDFPEVRYPDSWETQETREKRQKAELESLIKKVSYNDFQQTLEDGKSIETIIKSKHWEKTYNPGDNTVYAKIPNSYDGNEYTIYPDGKVVVTNGWGKNEVEREANKELADYVKQRQEEYENAIHKGFENKFGNEQIAQKPAQKPIDNEYKLKDYTQAELDEKANVFADRLNSRQWKKEYLPENDIIMIRNKRVKDGLEYMIKNDGTVLETGLRNKALTIIEPSSDSAKMFAKYKKKLDPNAPKTSLWMKGKEAIADVWKFFTVTGTMGIATAKGLWQGALAGAAVLGTATLIRGTISVLKKAKTISDMFKHPLQTAGLPGKLLAIAVGGLVLTGNIIAGKLKANQKSAVIEHKIDVPHYND